MKSGSFVLALFAVAICETAGHAASVTIRGPMPLQTVPLSSIRCYATNYGSGPVDVTVEIFTNTGAVLATSGVVALPPYGVAEASVTFQSPPTDAAAHCRAIGLSPRKGAVLMNGQPAGDEPLNGDTCIPWLN